MNRHQPNRGARLAARLRALPYRDQRETLGDLLQAQMDGAKPWCAALQSLVDGHVDALSEAEEERRFASYWGGSAPQGITEQYQAAHGHPARRAA